MISAYSLVIVIGWGGWLVLVAVHGGVGGANPHPPRERPAGGGLGGEPDVVVRVLPLNVGELVLAVLEVARLFLGLFGGVSLQVTPFRSERIVESSRRSWLSSSW